MTNLKERKKVSKQDEEKEIDRSVECIKKREIKKEEFHSILLVKSNFQNALIFKKNKKKRAQEREKKKKTSSNSPHFIVDRYA